MEGFLNRYRSITVLLLVIFAQLILIAVRVKNDQDVRVIRVWAVTAVTPVARLLEGVRGGGIGFVRNYIMLRDADTENRRLRQENGQLKLDNLFLKNELNRADRAKALEVFQSQTASKMVAATIIATGPGSTSKVVFVDRGSASGIMRGMAVVTPDGIVGKVIASYPTASEVLLITDPDFAAGVIAQKSQVRGTLKGEGTPMCRVDYVPLEEKLLVGDVFYTSGDDRIFPSGFPVGVVKSVRPGTSFQEVEVQPLSLQHGLMEDVLILTESVHQGIPEAPAANQPIYIAPPPPTSGSEPAENAPAATGTEADRLRQIYKSVGDAQGHTFGEGNPGSKPPDFTKLPTTVPTTPGAAGPVGTTGTRGPAGSTGAVAPPPVAPADPAKKQPLPSPTAAKPGETVRHTNQAAGAPGGPPRE